MKLFTPLGARLFAPARVFLGSKADRLRRFGGRSAKNGAREVAAEEQPLRGELLSLELLKQSARSLAQNRRVENGRGPNMLLPRLAANEKILRDYNYQTLRVEKTRPITPAAEWLLDNFPLLEEQIRTAQRHLPRGFNRQLPQLLNGPWRAFPRVYEIAVEIVSHTDGRIDVSHLTSFVAGYQEIAPLKLGELWAIPIMLRLALIENLRRVAAQLNTDRNDRDEAGNWASRILQVAESNSSDLIIVVGEMAQSRPALSRAFVTEFSRRLQEKSPAPKLAMGWIEDCLAAEGLIVGQLVQSESQFQAATQATVGNSICSLRCLDTMDWREFVETQSVVEQTLRLDPTHIYERMDFATRDRYRHTVERIARYSRKSEIEVAQLAIGLAQPSINRPDDHLGHVGFYLIGRGLKTLERAAGITLPLRDRLSRFARKYPLAFYLGGILAVSLMVTIPLMQLAEASGISSLLVGIVGLLALLCSSQLAVSLINWCVTLLVQPFALPRLDFSKGIPAADATLVVVPTMLVTVRGVETLLEALEIRYLANRDPQVFFALLTDFPDAPNERQPGDEELLRCVREGIRDLNRKYESDRSSIFYCFHRARRWNEAEKVWMGYERKRGKLAALNRCLRGGGVAWFSEIAGDLAVLPHIQYVITLDTDTQLPPDSARQLAATMAHPLNRPVYDTQKGVVVEGYTILQPRVAVSLPKTNRSRFVKIFSGEPGIDPYTRMVSDVYQDVFHEGSFIGKGIYDVDAFERAVGGKFPENRILSHDLLEGSYARCALVSDVQFFEAFPSRYSADTRRRHRWMRGDWQIAAWLLPRLPRMEVRGVQNPLTGLSRWKIFDNLRRSLVPFGLVFLFLLGALLDANIAGVWATWIIVIIALPSLLAVFTEILRKPKNVSIPLHLRNAHPAMIRQLAQAILTVAFLPYDAVISLDAVVRTLWRLIVSRRNLLEWQTSSEAEKEAKNSMRDFFSAMGCVPVLALGAGALIFFLGTPPSAMVVGLLALWLVSPAIAWWISLPCEEKVVEFSTEQIRQLHKLARKTWNFFEAFVTAGENWLTPDNFQEYPHALIAGRTSPTNLGFLLLSTLAAHDFGYISLRGLIERISRTLETMEKLERYRGHFYNWYDTRTLKPMGPLYLSTVDNGNLAGFLLTLHSGLLELVDQDWSAAKMAAGLRDTLDVLQELPEQFRPAGANAALASLGKMLEQVPKSSYECLTWLDGLMEGVRSKELNGGGPTHEFEIWRNFLEQSCREHREEILRLFPWVRWPDLCQWLASRETAPPLKKLWAELDAPASLRRLAEEPKNWLAVLDDWPAPGNSPDGGELEKPGQELRATLTETGQNARACVHELEALARRCEDLARMDFTILYDPARELFAIGYSVSEHRLETSCYDLLASEARLASYVAIALGQVGQSHWFRLGRSLTSAGGFPTLISWSGSMFEYLMPLLVMPTYENTLLDRSCKSAVARQIQYGRQLNVPWGISESGYNLRDTAANYQYRAFGVPGLGFKRGLAHDLVIAPYATVMALMVAPEAACQNLEKLRKEQAAGKFGLYEALDYTPSRVPNGQTHAVIRSFMAHHQGMSLLSLAGCLLDRPMQRRFDACPLFKSAELLLHERVPRETSLLHPHELEANREREAGTTGEATMRVFTEPNSGPPEVHLLSNGRYHVMITSAGGGYSRWQDTLLTRWREDSTQDAWGTFFYLRDTASGAIWSPTQQPTWKARDIYEAIFSQGRAEFHSRLHDIDTRMEIAVSPENDVEVRRLTFVNHAEAARTIEVTTYAEVVLNTAAADAAHPAFSSLFIQTEINPRQNAILCSRRPRSSNEKLPWLGQVLLLQGHEVGSISFETERARFLGRGGNPTAPAVLKHAGPLANSAGPVLDPIVSIRRTLRLDAKESATVTLISGIAPTRDEILGLMEKYQDHTIANRCFELAWTHGLIMLRHLNTTEVEAQLFGRLAGGLLFLHPARRASPSILARNRRGQRNLWSFGISGDLPILLLYATNLERVELVRQIVLAHAYWRLKGLAVDLVILNEEDSIYRAALHDQILSLVTTNSATQLLDKPGGIFLRRADQFSPEDKVLLEAAARIVLHDDRGRLSEQLSRRVRPEPLPPSLRVKAQPEMETNHELPARALQFFNGLGGFTLDGREYLVTLPPNAVTPAPWVNVLANPNFGTLISECGGAYTWSENCHEFRLTPWNNDPVTDASGEAIFLRDEDTGQFWSPTPLPARGESPFVVRHGFGYSIFEHRQAGISSELTIYVSAHEPVKFAVVKLRNLSRHTRRRLSLTGFWEWVLGETRPKNALHIATEIDGPSRALLARNPYNTDFEGRVAFVACSEPGGTCSADRAEFLGRNGTLARPAALRRSQLSGRTGVGFDPCAALQVPVELEPGQEREIAFILGAGQNLESARDLARRFQSLASCHEELQKVRDFWENTLNAVQVETPEPALNLLANGWLLYQTISCRLFARTGFYQSGGAYGFRDQLQDAMTLIHTRRELLREQLLRAAAHQFREGDVQHWWHPPLGRGVRTHFSDDYLWLPYATCRYVKAVGDTGVLDSEVPFLEGRTLREDEEAIYDLPTQTAESGTLYEHCVRAIRHGLKFGQHGLPLMGCGDWNDGMNLVGDKGKGESVWLGFFLYDVLKQFSALAGRRGDQAMVDLCETQAKSLGENLEKQAWDGQWYRRAYFDNGEPLGSVVNSECQIDSLPQSWAVISGLGSRDRMRSALEAVADRLVRPADRLIQLFDPPFDKSRLEPGYIRGYVPGVRENGGQYTHAAIWTIMAFALAGETDRAWELFQFINPILHAQEPDAVARYKVEPYVVAADVYSLPPHVGRGGWTWYTGSAGWMYRLIVETLLGVELTVDELRFTPRVPRDWSSFKLDYRYRTTVFHITLHNAAGGWEVPPKIFLDGNEQRGAALKLVDDHREHFAEVRFEPENSSHSLEEALADLNGGPLRR